MIDSDFGSMFSGGYYYFVSSFGSGGGFCIKIDEEEIGVVFVDMDCRSCYDSVEY